MNGRMCLAIALAAFAGLLLIKGAKAQQQPQEYTIKLTAAEVDIVGKGLGLLPYQDVALVIQKLREQIVAQQNKPVDGQSSSEKDKK